MTVDSGVRTAISSCASRQPRATLRPMFTTTASLTARRSLGAVARRLPHFRGKHRVLRVADQALCAVSAEPVSACIDELRYELDTRDLIAFSLFYLGQYQGELTRFLSSALTGDEPVFWDVGANIGAVSLPVARARPNARVVSFEPSQSVRARLEANLAVNASLRSRIHVRSEALNDVSGTAEFFESNEIENAGIGGLGRSGNRESSGFTVQCVRADDLVERGQVPAPDVVKIDVEGAELEVLRGFEGLFAAGRPIQIVFEHQLYRLEERNQPRDEVVRYLRSHGFELFRMPCAGQRELRPLAPGDLDGNCDLLARR